MPKKDNYLRKFIYFDDKDPHQRELFNMLDKVRYYQSRLVVKLLDNFFKKNNITANTPYDKVQMIVKLFINDMEAPEEQSSEGTASNTQNDLSSALLSIAMAINGQISSNGIPASATVTAKQEKSQIKVSDIQSPPDIIPHEEVYSDTDLEEDDENEDVDLMQMAKGFQSMIGE